MRRSPAVARQFLPDVFEAAATDGQDYCFKGLLDTGVPHVERMYLDRCIIMPQPTCPAYCRFCFRKFYEHSDGKAMSYPQLEQAALYVAAQPSIREVLITGGEPMMDQQRLHYLLALLRRIDHVGPIRIACRSLVMEPSLVNSEIIDLLTSHQDLRAGQPIEIALHCNHPEEISPETIEALAALREAGLHVYNQSVLLRDVNLNTETMLELLRRLRAHGVETYNLFFAGPVKGMEHQRPTIDQALALKSDLRARISGRAVPHLIVTTRLGKVEIGVDGWIESREPEGRFCWIRTPHRLELLRQIDPSFVLPSDARLDQGGYIVVRYLDGPSTSC